MVGELPAYAKSELRMGADSLDQRPWANPRISAGRDKHLWREHRELDQEFCLRYSSVQEVREGVDCEPSAAQPRCTAEGRVFDN